MPELYFSHGLMAGSQALVWMAQNSRALAEATASPWISVCNRLDGMPESSPQSSPYHQTRCGRSELVPNSLGARLTPSVSVDENGQLLVGLAARERQVTHPQRTATTFKRLMGTDRAGTRRQASIPLSRRLPLQAGPRGRNVCPPGANGIESFASRPELPTRSRGPIFRILQ